MECTLQTQLDEGTVLGKKWVEIIIGLCTCVRSLGRSVPGRRKSLWYSTTKMHHVMYTCIQCLATSLLAQIPLSSLAMAYPMITHTLLVFGNLPINSSVARQWPTIMFSVYHDALLNLFRHFSCFQYHLLQWWPWPMECWRGKYQCSPLIQPIYPVSITTGYREDVRYPDGYCHWRWGTSLGLKVHTIMHCTMFICYFPCACIAVLDILVIQSCTCTCNCTTVDHTINYKTKIE